MGSQNHSSAAEIESQSSSRSGLGPADELSPEVSVVIPCLNEADTLATCIEKAKRAFESRNIHGEILVADNGSTDGSQEIALKKGARLVRYSLKATVTP